MLGCYLHFETFEDLVGTGPPSLSNSFNPFFSHSLPSSIPHSLNLSSPNISINFSISQFFTVSSDLKHWLVKLFSNTLCGFVVFHSQFLWVRESNSVGFHDCFFTGFQFSGQELLRTICWLLNTGVQIADFPDNFPALRCPLSAALCLYILVTAWVA